MEKEFFDVFPNLKLKQELSELLEEVIVTKVACNSAKTCVRVYLKSDRWIHKKHIFSLEEQIQRQCFPGLEVSVKVIEKFHLSRQYTKEFPGYLSLQHGTGASQLQHAGIQSVQAGTDHISRR